MKELCFILFIVGNAIIMGYVVPYLLRRTDDISVIIGVATSVGVFTLDYFIIKFLVKREDKRREKQLSRCCCVWRHYQHPGARAIV